MTSLIQKILIIFIISSLSVATFASSSGSYGGSSNSSRGGDYNRKPIDQNYELGKAVYLGRATGKKLQYCIDNGSQKVKLKSKTAKAFKNKNANNFANALYDCNKPSNQIASTLNRRDLTAVVYYLNKRYRLKLRGI